VSELLFDFSRENLYISAFAHVLGALQNNLEDLARDGLLASSVASLEQIGYRYNRSAEPGTKLVDFAAGVFKKLFEECGSPDALVVHHSYSVNTSDPFPAGSRELLARAKYFPSSLLRHFQLVGGDARAGASTRRASIGGRVHCHGQEWYRCSRV
jgi:hypothetical protein